MAKYQNTKMLTRFESEKRVLQILLYPCPYYPLYTHPSARCEEWGILGIRIYRGGGFDV